MPNIQTIYFAGGCFWGTEHFFKMIAGVESTKVGYANSLVENPTYKQVCTGTTLAAETVRVVYDADAVGLPMLIDLYMLTIDPTSLNRQGGDIGTQYRTGIYYTTDEQRQVVEQCLARLEREAGVKFVIEVKPIENFYPAEDYHQDYLDKNPGGYCHVDPRLFALARQANRK